MMIIQFFTCSKNSDFISVRELNIFLLNFSSIISVIGIVIIVVLIDIIVLIKYLQQHIIKSSVTVVFQIILVLEWQFFLMLFSHQSLVMILIIQSKPVHYLVISMNNVMHHHHPTELYKNIHIMSMSFDNKDGFFGKIFELYR